MKPRSDQRDRSSRNSFKLLAELIWDKAEGSYGNISPTGRWLGLISDGQTYGARQVTHDGQYNKRIIGISKERGVTDIVFIVKSSGHVAIYLTSEKGQLIMAKHHTSESGREVPKAEAENAFRMERTYWVNTLATKASIACP